MWTLCKKFKLQINTMKQMSGQIRKVHAYYTHCTYWNEIYCYCYEFICKMLKNHSLKIAFKNAKAYRHLNSEITYIKSTAIWNVIFVSLAVAVVIIIFHLSLSRLVANDSLKIHKFTS